MMGYSAENFRDSLLSLLPKGRAWKKDKGSTFYQLMYGLGEEFARIDKRSEDLFNESFVRRTIELITEHEFDYGLPENGKELPASIDERRANLYAKLIAVGGQHKEYYIEILEGLGYSVYDIVEFRPFWAGIGAAGDPCGSQDIIFFWWILIEVTDDMFTTATWKVNLTTAISTINKLKPGHTHPEFAFGGVGFSSGFDRGFESAPYYDATYPPGGFDSGFDLGFESVNQPYDGVNLIGGFDGGFNVGFNRYSGGGFSDGFSIGFDIQK
jgi:uncharacterized protein YmfQ (DUF2313 family)